MNILVIGSFMMDLVVLTPKAPENGETIIGESFSRYPGGKGANQAVTAARLGEKVSMIGKVGKDEFGDEAIHVLEKEGVNTKHILRDSNHPTGVGSVTLDSNGNNRIIVVPGANTKYNAKELVKVQHLIKDAKVVLLQLEMHLDLVEKAIDLAHLYDIPVILNPAPAVKLKDDVLRKVTYITPNETEAEILTGIKVMDIESAELAGRFLLNKGVKHVIITLADKGAVIINDYGVSHVPAFPVKSVDSVGAGDAFNGALAVGVANKEPLEKVVKMANVAGALTVTKQGAIPSLPFKEAVEKFISNQRVI